jgi:hypothetical protein
MAVTSLKWPDIRSTQRHGNGAYGQASDGTGASGNIPKYDAAGNLVDSGVAASSLGGLPLWLQYHPDAYPASPNAMDDEFDGGSVNTGLWTAVNTSGAMVFTQSRGRLIATPTSDTGAFRGYYQALPGSGAWQFRSKIYFDPTSSSDVNVAGIMFYESSSGKTDVLYFGRVNSGTYSVKLDYWTGSGTSFGGNFYASTISTSPITQFYMLIGFDGSTNYTIQVSGSGVSYYTIPGRTTSDFTTKADRIALVYFSNQSGLGDPAYWEFFRRTI